MRIHENGKDRDMTPDEEAAHLASIGEPKKGYGELRSSEYGPIADQMDMIYWDKVNGTNLWQQHIAAVKAKYPKPE